MAAEQALHVTLQVKHTCKGFGRDGGGGSAARSDSDFFLFAVGDEGVSESSLSSSPSFTSNMSESNG